MTHKLKLLAAGSGIALAVLGANPAFAAGTTAGSTITNTATVNFTVGGVAQTAQTATNNLTVDRKIDIRVTAGADVTVTPGQVNPVQVFTVSNLSNSVMDIDLLAAAQASGAAIGGARTSTFAAGSTIVLHTGSASGPVVTYLDEVAADAVTTIYAVDTTAYTNGVPTSGSIPLATANGGLAGVTLTATARQGGTAGSEGATVTTSTPYGGANNVFAEPAGFGSDAANNGVSVASDVYIVSAPSLTVNKLSYVVWDPINLTTSPKAIPGAIVRYCIVVTNGAGGATATAPTVSDPLPSQVTAVANSLYLNGTASAVPVCNTSFATYTTGTGASGTAAATQITTATTTVSGALADLAGGSSETLYFDVKIN